MLKAREFLTDGDLKVLCMLSACSPLLGYQEVKCISYNVKCWLAVVGFTSFSDKTSGGAFGR